MRKYILILSLLILTISVKSQTVVMHQDVNDTLIPTNGPNLKNFSHFYIGYGFIAGKSEGSGSDIIYGRPGNFVLGFRYKFKVCNVYSIGFDVSFNTYTYNLKQDSAKIFPNNFLHDKEKLNLTNFGLGLYNRFNYGRRGNMVGNFIDLGAYADWTAGANNYTRDKMPNGNIVKTTISKLNYIEPFNYGVFGRIGFNRYVIFGNYRITDIFKPTYTFSELPRLTIGFQIGLHK
jgi:hypothetical protein